MAQVIGLFWWFRRRSIHYFCLRRKAHILGNQEELSKANLLGKEVRK